MPSLREIQRGMSAAIVFGDRAALASLGVVAGTIGAAARIDVYRQNVLGNYRKALAATFPVVRRVVGAPFFNAAVDAFARSHPSTRGDVNRYGGDLPRFLASYGPARALSYLADVARLEWAIDQAGIAADAPGFDLAALAAVAPDAYGDLRLGLHPSAQLFESHYPALRIWQANQPAIADPPAVDLGEGGDLLLVARGARGVAVERVSPGEAALLGALAANASLGAAARCASDAEPSFDLPAALRRHIAGHVVVTLHAPRSSVQQKQR